MKNGRRSFKHKGGIRRTIHWFPSSNLYEESHQCYGFLIVPKWIPEWCEDFIQAHQYGYIWTVHKHSHYVGLTPTRIVQADDHSYKRVDELLRNLADEYLAFVSKMSNSFPMVECKV